MTILTSTVNIWGKGTREITIEVSDLFLAHPTTPTKMSAFIGEDIRSAKVYKHIQFPQEGILYQLKDNRIALKINKSGGSWYTIMIFANRQECDAHLDQHTCIFDPETGKLWGK